MDFDSLLDVFNEIPSRTYGYIGLGVIFGPFMLRLLGFRTLGNLARGAGLAAILLGVYARQQAGRGGEHRPTIQ
ncbi:MAG: hypothetical protein NVS4B8_28800 [Herpetosiphon sp.]